MTKHFHRDLENLQKEILSLSSQVEDMIDSAGRCLFEPNPELAREVIEADKQVDQREVMIEEECLKMLALHQPVAGDLRYIVAALKIDRDLERIADLAAHVAERALALFDLPPLDIPFRIDEMGEKAQAMLKKALDAFVSLNVAAAHEVCALDGEINAIKKETFRQVRLAVMEVPGIVVALAVVFLAWAGASGWPGPAASGGVPRGEPPVAAAGAARGAVRTGVAGADSGPAARAPSPSAACGFATGVGPGRALSGVKAIAASTSPCPCSSRSTCSRWRTGSSSATPCAFRKAVDFSQRMPPVQNIAIRRCMCGSSSRVTHSGHWRNDRVPGSTARGKVPTSISKASSLTLNGSSEGICSPGAGVRM